MYDLFILTFSEKKRSCVHLNKFHVKALNKKGETRQKYYHKIWPFINNCYGILYKIFTKQGLGEFECCDDIFEFNASNDVEFWFQKFVPDVTEGCIDDLTSIKLNVIYKEEFISMFDGLLSCSPISTVAFLCRGQSLDKEIVIGTLSRNDFLEMLCSGNIKTNICYLVENSNTTKDDVSESRTK